MIYAPPPVVPYVAPVRRRPRALVAVAAIVALAAGVGVGVTIGLVTRGTSSDAGSPSTATGPAAVQARALLQQALAVMGSSAGFHYVAVSTDGTITQTTVGDAGTNGGDQLITVNSPTVGNERFTLVLISGTVYFQGNVPALEDQLTLTAAAAAPVDGKWVAVASSDAPYSIIEPGITVADQAKCTLLAPTSTAQVTTSAGAKATRIFGTVPGSSQCGSPIAATGHLDVTAGSHRAIAYASTATDTTGTSTSTVTFSGWDRAPIVTVPAGAVAWSSLGAGATPGAGSTPSPTAPA